MRGSAAVALPMLPWCGRQWATHSTQTASGLTGAAGGVLRDVFINEIPLIFRKDIYAMACVMGGVAYAVCGWIGTDNILTQIVCGISVFLTRILAVKYHISLPTLKGENEKN